MSTGFIWLHIYKRNSTYKIQREEMFWCPERTSIENKCRRVAIQVFGRQFITNDLKKITQTHLKL